MNSTKQGIVKAGAIVAIVLACLMLLGAITTLPVVNTVFSEDAIIETFKTEPGYNYVEDGDTYYIEYLEEGVAVKLTENDIMFTVNIMKQALNIAVGLIAVMAVVSILIASFLISSVNKSKRCTGKIVALLIMSILTGNAVTMALMITALCIKDKKITLENIDEYYQEDKF